MQVRRVVTGEIDGRSSIVADERVEGQTAALLAGYVFHTLWGDDETPQLPSAGAEPAHPAYFAPPRGFRFISITFPGLPAPAPPGDLDMDAAAREVQEKFPGLAEATDAEGWHATDTIDVFVILRGQARLVLQDGETVLGPGDVYVQNGTLHRWEPASAEPCQMLGVVVGAERRG